MVMTKRTMMTQTTMTTQPMMTTQTARGIHDVKVVMAEFPSIWRVAQNTYIYMSTSSNAQVSNHLLIENESHAHQHPQCRCGWAFIKFLSSKGDDIMGSALDFPFEAPIEYLTILKY